MFTCFCVSSAVPRLLQKRAQAGDHDAVAGRVHAVLVLHAQGQVPGAAAPAHVRGGHQGVQEEARAARQGPGLRAVLQRRGRRGCGGALRALHAALGLPPPPTNAFTHNSYHSRDGSTRNSR